MGRAGEFSAGGDLKGYLDLYRKPLEFRRFLEDFHSLLDRIEASGNIHIAVIEGYCVAGGLEVLLPGFCRWPRHRQRSAIVTSISGDPWGGQFATAPARHRADACALPDAHRRAAGCHLTQHIGPAFPGRSPDPRASDFLCRADSLLGSPRRAHSDFSDMKTPRERSFSTMPLAAALRNGDRLSAQLRNRFARRDRRN